MPKAIKQLADAYLTNPAEVAVTPAATTVERIQQSVTHVNQAEKAALLTLFLQKTGTERTLVFSRTKHGADKIVRQLAAAGIESMAIHGNKSQPQRERAISAFKSGHAPVLVATDIAARGIDIPGVAHVVNFDLPDVPEQYVHRIGRTARAGADGCAIAFCSPEERLNLRDIERLTRMKIDVEPLPEGFVAAAQAFKALKLPTPQREERGSHGRGGFAGGRRDGGHRHARPAAPRATIQATGANDRDRRRDDQRPAQGHQRRDDVQRPAYGERNGPRHGSGPRQDGQRHPQRAGGHPAHRPEGGAGKRPFRGRKGPGRFQRAQG
jgi:ATP-dependent RNA helicase RhlE